MALTEQFEAHRGRLRAVAERVLGSPADAEDAVQETWLRLHRADAGDVSNLGGWLTTVLTRICLDMLRARQARRESALDLAPEPAVTSSAEQDAELADSVGAALVVVLDALRPTERLAFVLHDMFAVPYDEIARMVQRSPEAVRQMVSRARRRVRGPAAVPAGPARHREVVAAFLAAARQGDFAALLDLLAPDAVLRSDAAATAIGAPAELVGAAAVAGRFHGGATAARLALLDGTPGLVWSIGGTVRVAFEFDVVADQVTAIRMVGDPAVLARLDIELLTQAGGRSASTS